MDAQNRAGILQQYVKPGGTAEVCLFVLLSQQKLGQEFYFWTQALKQCVIDTCCKFFNTKCNFDRKVLSL